MTANGATRPYHGNGKQRLPDHRTGRHVGICQRGHHLWIAALWMASIACRKGLYHGRNGRKRYLLARTEYHQADRRLVRPTVTAGAYGNSVTAPMAKHAAMPWVSGKRTCWYAGAKQGGAVSPSREFIDLQHPAPPLISLRPSNSGTSQNGTNF